MTDLYQAAFRINYSSAWRVDSVEQGDFLGPEAETLFIGLTNQSGFVPVSITRLGNAAGVDGDGVLATIVFEPTGTASASSVPFDLAAPMLITGGGLNADV